MCDVAEMCDGTSMSCPADASAPDGTSCDIDGNPATPDVCLAGVCTGSSCGDGTVDMASGEQCDDMNTTRLDGCDPFCLIEQSVRFDSIAVQGPSFGCTDIDSDGSIDNQIGTAFSSTARSQLNGDVATSVDNGDFNLLMPLLGLDDLLGQNDPALRLGIVNSNDAVSPFDGTRGEDFLAWASAVDGTGLPTSIVDPAMVSGGMLTSSGRIANMDVLLYGDWVSWTFERARISGTVVPDTGMMRVDSISNGMLCGAIPAASLDRSVMPDTLASVCPAYAGDSFLDALVGGCRFSFITLITGSQPDIDIEGDGIYSPALEDTNGDGRIDRCRDGASGTIITGDNCAQDPRFDDAYSVAFSYTAIRADLVGVAP